MLKHFRMIKINQFSKYLCNSQWVLMSHGIYLLCSLYVKRHNNQFILNLYTNNSINFVHFYSFIKLYTKTTLYLRENVE